MSTLRGNLVLHYVMLLCRMAEVLLGNRVSLLCLNSNSDSEFCISYDIRVLWHRNGRNNHSLATSSVSGNIKTR